VIAIANSTVRKKLAVRCINDGHKFWSVKALNKVIMDDVKIGEGAILNPFVTLTSNIKIG
jgi:acetyltransferase-like isoleucine patch superfamily enzyme